MRHLSLLKPCMFSAAPSNIIAMGAVASESAVTVFVTGAGSVIPSIITMKAAIPPSMIGLVSMRFSICMGSAFPPLNVSKRITADIL